MIHSWNLDNFRAIADAPYPTIILRTLLIASAVTSRAWCSRSRTRTSSSGSPAGGFGSRSSSRRVLPLWVSYLVRVYSWRLILNPDGALN